MMYNGFFIAKNLDEAWKHWFEAIQEEIDLNVKLHGGHEVMNSRDGEVVGEIINATTVIEDVTRCIMTNPIRKLPMRYCVGELLWYMSGNNELSSIQLYTKAWDRMSDDGVTVNSNYGHCIRYKFGFDQWEFVKNLLTEHPETRQAVIHIKEARDLRANPSKDVNCTVCLQFFIREGKLYLTTYMRSNDLWMGFPNDVFQFTALQIKLAMELGLELGTYTHHAGSLHLYRRDYDKAVENATMGSCKGGKAVEG